MKEPGLKADHSLLPIVQLNNTCSYTSTLPYTFMPYKVTTLPLPCQFMVEPLCYSHLVSSCFCHVFITDFTKLKTILYIFLSTSHVLVNENICQSVNVTFLSVKFKNKGSFIVTSIYLHAYATWALARGRTQRFTLLLVP